MLFLRVFVVPARAAETIGVLAAIHGLENIVHMQGVEMRHGEDLVTATVEPGAANEVVDRLRELHIERPGAVALIRQDHTEVRPIEDDTLGYWDPSADSVVVEEIVDEARENARLSLTYLAYMVTAGMIAGIGVGQDQTVLIVGAMAISPDLLPLSAICVGLVARERRTALVGVGTLLSGLGIAALAAGTLVWVADLLGIVTADLGKIGAWRSRSRRSRRPRRSASRWVSPTGIGWPEPHTGIGWPEPPRCWVSTCCAWRSRAH